MKLPRLDMGAALGPAVERMLYEGRERRPRPLSAKELRAEGVMTVLFVVAVTCLARGFDDDIDLDVGLAVALTLAFSLAARVRFSVGPGYTSPVQLIFVPMLLFLPAPAVPVCVAAGYALAKLADAAGGRGHRDRVLTAAPDACFSIGPAIVFAAANLGGPDWADAPIY